MLKTTSTLSYYNNNAALFTASTVDVEFHNTQDRFLKYLSPVASILDFGCGSGRDTKYFMQKGYNVTATDGSEELCMIAATNTGRAVRWLLFQDLNDIDTYDGIWACASILHVPKNELTDIFRRMLTALRKNGYIYTSFKYSSFEGERNGRYFSDFEEDEFRSFISAIPQLTIKELWVSNDVRPGRSEEKWLNVILQKTAG